MRIVTVREPRGSVTLAPLVRFADGRYASDKKKFAEPVALSSTASADLPLPGTALRSDFALLALRARRKSHTNVPAEEVKGSKRVVCAICALFFFLRRTSDSCSLSGPKKTKVPRVGGTKKIRGAGFAFVHHSD